MNAFADYGMRATTTAVPRLVGSIRTRSEAKARYVEIVSALNACSDSRTLTEYLSGIEAETAQFHAELELLWEGDGDFAGLRREIERAQVRVDEGLDYPRHEEPKQETEQ